MNSTAISTTAAQATITTMIVCVPQEIPTSMLATTAIDRYLGVKGQTVRRFWTSDTVRVWQQRQLVNLHKGRPGFCAGGPKKLLNLETTSHTAGLHAGMRHRKWADVIKGTKEATPWHIFAAKHAADPERLPLERAQRAFESQPRVQAMRMHNAVTFRPGDKLDVMELDVLQHGHVTYQNYHYLHAVCADAVLGTDGRQIAAGSDALADRTGHLAQAHSYLTSLDDSTRLLAVAL